MSIFKGVIGRDLADIKEQLRQQALGGVDLIKDDEIFFENELAPFETRIIEGKQVLKETREETGHKTLYAVNLTGRTAELRDKARRAAELGADALLLNVFAYGLDVMQSLAEDRKSRFRSWRIRQSAARSHHLPFTACRMRFCSAS